MTRDRHRHTCVRLITQLHRECLRSPALLQRQRSLGQFYCRVIRILNRHRQFRRLPVIFCARRRECQRLRILHQIIILPRRQRQRLRRTPVPRRKRQHRTARQGQVRSRMTRDRHRHTCARLITQLHRECLRSPTFLQRYRRGG